jgi:rhodanese-related sulfurtransferase
MSRKHINKPKQHSVHSSAQKRQQVRKRNVTLVTIGVAALIIILAGIFIFLPKGTPPPEITPAQAYEKYQQGAFILDVRTQEEWDEFHIAGSTLIPLDELADRVNEVPKDRDIVVVCRSGRRSQSGAAILQNAGFTHVSSMSGGLNAWKSANYPVEGKTP